VGKSKRLKAVGRRTARNISPVLMLLQQQIAEWVLMAPILEDDETLRGQLLLPRRQQDPSLQ
jgi:hypothetical protein